MAATTLNARIFPQKVTGPRLAGRSSAAARVVRPRVTGSALRRCTSLVVASAASEETKMREAEQRWQENGRSGRVRNLTGKDIKPMLESGWTVLDVRPREEIDKVGLKGVVEVPLFEVDDGMDPASLLKQMSAFGMGGWWLGGQHMKANTQFLAQVQSKIPKDAKVIVTCQKGLRSLAACEQLSRAGYSELAWVSGGLDAVRKGEVDTTVDKDLRYAGIGGVSALLGWTEVQQEENRGSSFQNVLKGVAFLLVVDLVVFAAEQVQYMSGN